MYIRLLFEIIHSPLPSPCTHLLERSEFLPHDLLWPMAYGLKKPCASLEPRPYF